MKGSIYTVTNNNKVYMGVLIHSISSKACGIDWHPTSKQLDFSIGLNQYCIF